MMKMLMEAFTGRTSIKKDYGGMEAALDFSPDDISVQHLVSLICSFPFKGDVDYQEMTMNSCEFESVISKTKGGLFSFDMVDILRWRRRRRRKDTLFKAFRDSYYTSIHNNDPINSVQLYKHFARRSSIELNEMLNEFSVTPDLWIHRLNTERNYYSSLLRQLVNCFKKVSLEKEIKLLLDARKCLEHDSPHNPPDLTLLLSPIQNLASHPFFDQLILFDANSIAKVGSNLTGVPPTWLSSCLMPPNSWPLSLLTKFPAHLHAVTVLKNFFASATVRDGRPLAVFLVHDPGYTLTQDFATDVSESLYGTTHLTLRFDLSTSGTEAEEKLQEFLVKVKENPFSVVLLENIDEAEDSIIEGLCFCLTNGHTMQGTCVDLSTTVFFIIFDSDHKNLMSSICGAVHGGHSGRKLMDLALDDSTHSIRCRCKDVLAEMQAKLKPEIWNLVDDVILLDLDAVNHIISYTRCLLRDIAERFCDGSLIIYPSDSALEFILLQSSYRKQSKALKRWLMQEVVPALETMESNGDIGGDSIVFIDTCVGHKGLVYRVEKADNYQLDEFAQNYLNAADECLAIYRNGKIFEENIKSLREMWDEVSKMVEGNMEERLSSLIKIVDKAVKAANDIHTSKEALSFSVEKFDAKGPAPVKQSIGGGTLTVEGNSKWPKLIKVLMRGFLGDRGSKLMLRPPPSYLILGLNDCGKKKLLDELKKNDMGIDLFESECSKEQFVNRTSGIVYGWGNVIEHVKDNPRCILYFDRLERAPTSVFSLLISLLRHGVQVDCDRNKVDFRQTLVIISTDVGNKDVMKQLVPHSGVVNDIVYPESREEGKGFRSELLKKVDEVVILNPFASQQLTAVTRIPINVKRCLRACLNILFQQQRTRGRTHARLVKDLLKRSIEWEASGC